MKLTLIALAAAAVLTGCFSNESPTSPKTSDGRKPGQIRLVAMNGLAKGAAASSYSFSLDTASTSIQQYFILQNTGDYDITDLDLTTNNPNFTFSPSHIAVLPPTAGASVLQVIRLDITHGKRLDGLGNGPFLTPGPINVLATLNGSTSTGSTEISVADSVNLTTFAKLAKFDVIAQGIAYPLTSLPNGWTGASLSVMGTSLVPHYYVPIDTLVNFGEVITLKNTGNVKLIVRRWTPQTSIELSTLTMAPGDSINFTAMTFLVDAGGVSYSPADLPVLASGKLPFILYGDRTP